MPDRPDLIVGLELVNYPINFIKCKHGFKQSKIVKFQEYFGVIDFINHYTSLCQHKIFL